MNEAAFCDLLRRVHEDLGWLKGAAAGGISLPNVDTTILTKDQLAAWQRIEYMTDACMTSDEPDNHYDPDCEGCRQLFGSSVSAARLFIEAYLAGKYTNATDVATVSYMKDDRSHSVSIAYYLDGDAIRFRDTTTEPVQLAIAHTRGKSFANLQEVTLPEQLGSYHVEPSTYRTSVIFKQEL